MEQVDCQRMEDNDVLRTADELIDFVELYNGNHKLHSIWRDCFQVWIAFHGTHMQIIKTNKSLYEFFYMCK